MGSKVLLLVAAVLIGIICASYEGLMSVQFSCLHILLCCLAALIASIGVKSFLLRNSRKYDGDGRNIGDLYVTDDLWVRLSAVVHDHFPLAARRVFEHQMRLKDPLATEAARMENLISALNQDKELLLKKLSRREKDVVYPRSRPVRLGDFDVVLWKKIMKHFFPRLEWKAMPTPQAIADLEKCLSEVSSPSSLVEGLVHFRNFIFRMGHSKMDEKDFKILWKCSEKLLRGLEYDVAKISEYKTREFDFTSVHAVIKRSLEGVVGGGAVQSGEGEEAAETASDDDGDDYEGVNDEDDDYDDD